MYKDEISFSTFCNKIDNIYKKPHRLTDLCEYCEIGNELKKEIQHFIQEYGFEYNELNITEVIRTLKKLKKGI